MLEKNVPEDDRVEDILRLPFVGRENELALLKLMLESASRGDGNTVFIVGKTGIGKSKLAEELKNYAVQNGFECIVKNFVHSPRPLTPFLDVVEVFESRAQPLYAAFDAVFAINYGGLLIGSASKLGGKVDDLIFSGMLTAMQYFIQDSFGDLKSGLELDGIGKLEYKDTTILLQSGKHIFVAGVLRGEEHPAMRTDLKNLVLQIEREYGGALARWDGDMSKVKSMNEYLSDVLERKYELGSQLESANLEINRLKTFENITNKLIAVAEKKERKGLLLILDDAHVADDFSFSYLQYLARNSRTARLLACILLRPEELDSAKTEIIRMMELEGICKKFELGALSFETTAQLLTQFFQCAPPTQFLKMFFEFTEGNPFYMKEFLHTFYDENLIFFTDRWQIAPSAYERLPKNAADIISRRLDRLPPDELNIAECCAVFGDKIDLHTFLDCFAEMMSKTKLRMLLKKLVAKKILVELPEAYLFEHLLLRNMLYDGIGTRRKRILHTKISNYFEALPESTDKIYHLAYHYPNTTNYWKAIEYNIKAGELALKNYAPLECINFYSTAIAMLDKIVLTPTVRQRKFELLEKTADIAGLSYNYELAIEKYKLGIELAEEEEACARLYRKIGTCYEAVGRYPDAIKYLTKGLNVLSSKRNLEYGRLCAQLGSVLLKEGDHYKATHYCDEALKNFAICKASKHDLGFVYQIIGNICFSTGEFEKSFENYEKSLKCRIEITDFLGGSMIYNNIALLFKSKGHHEKAIWYFNKSLALKTNIHDLSGIGMVYNNLGATYYSMGKFENALDAYMKSVQVRSKIGDLHGIAKVYNNIYVTYEELKDFEKAYEWKKRYSEVLEKIGLSQHQTLKEK